MAIHTMERTSRGWRRASLLGMLLPVACFVALVTMVAGCSNPTAPEESVLPRLWIDGTLRIVTGPHSEELTYVEVEVRMDSAQGEPVQDLTVLLQNRETLRYSSELQAYVSEVVPYPIATSRFFQFSDNVDSRTVSGLMAEAVDSITQGPEDDCWDLDAEWPIPDWGWYVTWNTPDLEGLGDSERLDVFAVCGPESTLTRVHSRYFALGAYYYDWVDADAFDDCEDVRAVLAVVYQITQTLPSDHFAHCFIGIEHGTARQWPVCERERMPFCQTSN